MLGRKGIRLLQLSSIESSSHGADCCFGMTEEEDDPFDIDVSLPSN